MIILPIYESSQRDFPDMTRDQLESERRTLQACLDQALAQKIEADRIYVAAATKLNTLERAIKKIEQHEAAARREYARSLAHTAQVAARV